MNVRLVSASKVNARCFRLNYSRPEFSRTTVTQLLRQGDAKVFKKYSQMKLQMKREALAKLNRKANDPGHSDTGNDPNSGTGEAA